MGVSEVSIVTEFKSQKYFPDNDCKSWWMQQPLEDNWSHLQFEAEVARFWIPDCCSSIVLHVLVASLTHATVASAHHYSWRQVDTSKLTPATLKSARVSRKVVKSHFSPSPTSEAAQLQQQTAGVAPPRPRESCQQPGHSALV